MKDNDHCVKVSIVSILQVDSNNTDIFAWFEPTNNPNALDMYRQFLISIDE